MIRPILRHLHSPDLDEPKLPPDRSNCIVLVQALVGPDNGPGEESFDFCVVTPTHLAEQHGPQWGRGLLIVKSFDWSVVREMVEKHLLSVAHDTWPAVGLELNKELRWEFDNYKERPDRSH